jgi:hypothetical protein
MTLSMRDFRTLWCGLRVAALNVTSATAMLLSL